MSDKPNVIPSADFELDPSLLGPHPWGGRIVHEKLSSNCRRCEGQGVDGGMPCEDCEGTGRYTLYEWHTKP